MQLKEKKLKGHVQACTEQFQVKFRKINLVIEQKTKDI